MSIEFAMELLADKAPREVLEAFVESCSDYGRLPYCFDTYTYSDLIDEFELFEGGL